MTESELRRAVADTVSGWVGGLRGGAEHQEILRIYNAHEPLARGYRVQVGDAYCATTVSAAWIRVGIAGYTGTECSCNRLIEIAKARDIWVEDDGYVPGIGDACVYDWDDDGRGDNVGRAEHIGIVSAVSQGGFTVAEGNTAGGRIGTRSMAVNGRYIRGFICPKYGEIAGALSEKEDEEMTGEEIYKRLTEYLRGKNLPQWVEDQGEYKKAVELGITDGSDPARFTTRYEAAIMVKRALDKADAAKSGEGEPE